MKTLDEIQAEVDHWATRNFGPNREAWKRLLGVQEEVGELSHHHLKRIENIRLNEDHNAGIRDAIADIVVYLLDYCNLEGISLQQELETTWEKVRLRDWVNHKLTGLPVAPTNGDATAVPPVSSPAAATKSDS